MNEQKNDPILSLYRSYLENEVRSKEVQAQKLAFVKRHFHARPLFLFQPAFAVPALSMAILFFFFLNLQIETYPRVKPSSLPRSVSAEVVAKSPLPQPNSAVKVDEGIAAPEPKVLVKRVASHVGSTMVYQKTVDNLPLTIVWVFPKGV